jgi:hypothetical protein
MVIVSIVSIASIVSIVSIVCSEHVGGEEEGEGRVEGGVGCERREVMG